MFLIRDEATCAANEQQQWSDSAAEQPVMGGGTKAPHRSRQDQRKSGGARRDVTRTDLVECLLRDPAEVHTVVAGGSHFHLGSRTSPLQGQQSIS